MRLQIEQALAATGSACETSGRRDFNRNRKGKGGGSDSAGGATVGSASSGGCATNINSSSNSNRQASVASPTYDEIKGKCLICLQEGHRWLECKMHIIPAPRLSSSGAYAFTSSVRSDIVCCLASTLGKNDASGEAEECESERVVQRCV